MQKLAGWDVDAVSVGGLETCIRLPQWDLCFDIGRCPPAAIAANRVLFTHAHIDHMGGVVHHCAMRDLQGRTAPEYWMPAEVVPAFEEMMAAWRRLAHSDLPCTVRGVSPGEHVPLGKGRSVQVFRAVHRVPSVGYALHQTKRKLLPELQGLSGPEIAALRKAGREVTSSCSSVEVAFCGDTTIDVVDREACVRAARLLILEVTFLDDKVSTERARRSGHVHIDDLVSRVDQIASETILCTHVSRRHHGQMEALFQQKLPRPEHDRFVLLMPAPPWAP